MRKTSNRVGTIWIAVIDLYLCHRGIIINNIWAPPLYKRTLCTWFSNTILSILGTYILLITVEVENIRLASFNTVRLINNSLRTLLCRILNSCWRWISRTRSNWIYARHSMVRSLIICLSDLLNRVLVASIVMISIHTVSGVNHI